MAYTNKDNISDFNSGSGLPGATPLWQDLALVSRQPGYNFTMQINCTFDGKAMTIWGGFGEGASITQANMLQYVALPCPPYNAPLVEV
ncbi:MAG: hypothetical protein GC192_05910 [Bacteroidetes bacterium]|nr:hypothetical protein [Bacteroidota bacterium]